MKGETRRETSQVCPKCHGEMKRRQRVIAKGSGLKKAFRLCRCGWAQDEGDKEGYWAS